MSRRDRLAETEPYAYPCSYACVDGKYPHTAAVCGYLAYGFTVSFVEIFLLKNRFETVSHPKFLPRCARHIP